MTIRLSAEQLDALAAKYACIAELRQRRERGEPLPDSSAFRDLARNFPGALRELDRMPRAVLVRRIGELQRARSSGIVLDWMVAMALYHHLLRYALAHKQGTPVPTDWALATIDQEFLGDIEQPPGGRLVPVVLAAMARSLGVDLDSVRALLEA